MKTLEADSIDAIVTDPPYGLEFMGKDWDAPWQTGTGTGEHNAGFSKGAPAVKGVRGEIKSLPSFTGGTNPTCRSCGGTKLGQDRVSRRKCACDSPSFPNTTLPRMVAFQAWCEEWTTECFRVLKPGGHLLSFGGTRTYHRLACGMEDSGFEIRDSIHWMYGSGFPKSRNLEGDFQGWGTALKPGHEPIVVARKPLVDTVAANVLLHGTGALNIDGCRIETADNLNGGAYSQKSNVPRNSGSWRGERASDSNAMRNAGLPGQYEQPDGRWPANVVFDEDAAAELKAARYFYTAKAARSERGAENDHPTVKPLSLMRWLVRLVTPRGGTLLDPFAGSGTTITAAIAERFDVIGIELDAHYCDLIRKRTSNVQQTLPMEEAV